MKILMLATALGAVMLLGAGALQAQSQDPHADAHALAAKPATGATPRA